MLRPVAFCPGALEALDDRLADDVSARLELGPNCLRLVAAGGGGDDAHAAMRITLAGHRLDRAAEHGFGDAASGRLGQRLADIIELLALIEVERLSEQRFLVAEGRIKARAGDPHRFGEVGQRRTLVALAPEDAQRLGQGMVNAKLARTAAGGNGFGFIHIERYIMRLRQKARSLFGLGWKSRRYPGTHSRLGGAQ